MNLFDDKSPTDLLAMVPGLSDPELDALCAKYCDGWYWETLKRGVSGYQETWCINPEGETREATPSYSSDPREAMRLLVKYQLEVGPNGGCGNPEVFWECAPCLDDIRGTIDEVSSGWAKNPCRAITLAAVTCELTRMIEGDGE